MNSQEDQPTEPTMLDTAVRNPNGTFAAGGVGNPSGYNGREAGWQPYGIRIQKWLAMPAEEVHRIMNSPQSIKKLSTIDVICLRHVANMIKGNDIHREREAMLDRVQGKVKQTTALEGPDGKPLFDPKVGPVVAASEEEALAAFNDTVRRAST